MRPGFALIAIVLLVTGAVWFGGSYLIASSAQTRYNAECLPGYEGASPACADLRSTIDRYAPLVPVGFVLLGIGGLMLLLAFVSWRPGIPNYPLGALGPRRR